MQSSAPPHSGHVMQSSAPPPSGQRGGIRKKIIKIRNKIDNAQKKVKYAVLPFVTPFLPTKEPVSENTASDRVTEEVTVAAPPPVVGNTNFDLVSEEETMEAFMYKMDKPRQQANELRVEIWWGNALWVSGHGDEPTKVKLRRNHKMRLSRATASLSADSVLTVVIPKRHRPRKWYEYKDLAFNKFKMFRVEVS